MKILHIQGAAQLAGCERTCELFMDGLRNAEHFVLVTGCDGPASEMWREVGAKVKVFGSTPGRIREYLLISRMVSELHPDAVIAWTSSRLGLKVAACRNAGAERIVVHVGNPVCLSLKNSIAAEAYTALPGARGATLIPVSRHVEISYQRRGGFRHFRSEVIYNGIALSHFEFKPESHLSENVRVGMVARLDQIKDHVTLLRAWSIVVRTRPGWHLDLAGDGPLRPELERLAKSLGISARVRFLGWVSDIPKIMSEWSIVVHSTTVSEGLGNSIMEAMSLGRPIVATGVAPILEITDGGRIARISRANDPEDLARQILDVESDWTRSCSQVVAARERLIRVFAPQRMIASYLRCLNLEIPQ